MGKTENESYASQEACCLLTFVFLQAKLQHNHSIWSKGWCWEIRNLHTNTESDAREWACAWVVKQMQNGVKKTKPANMEPAMLWNQTMSMCKWMHVHHVSERFFCIPRKTVLIFQESKWDSLLLSVWCDSLAVLTHPETCWMQPPLFAVLPSSTAPSTVAKQPTKT